MFWKKRDTVTCPICRMADAEIVGRSVEPGSNRKTGCIYGCLRCRTKFSVIRGEARAFGDVTPELVGRVVDTPHAAILSGHSPRYATPPAKPEREDGPLVQRDPDMRWDRSR